MKRKSIAYLIVVIAIASIALFSGCVEEKNIASMETPAVDTLPTSTPEQEAVPTLTPTPMPTVESAWEPDVTLKPGCKWYQDDDFGYGFAYPENWDKPHPSGDSSMINGVSLVSPEESESGWPEAMVMVGVYSKPNDFVFWEDSSGYIDYDSLEKAKEMRVISKYGNTTINGRIGFDVIYDPMGAMFYSSIKEMQEPINPTWTQRTIVFTIDDRDYVIMASSQNEFYNKHRDTYEDIINSYIIK